MHQQEIELLAAFRGLPFEVKLMVLRHLQATAKRYAEELSDAMASMSADDAQD